MTDIVKGMTNVCFSMASEFGSDEEAMRAALLWLANNIDHEMQQAFSEELVRRSRGMFLPYIAEGKALAAAIRAAAGGGE